MTDIVERLAYHIMEACDDFLIDNPRTDSLDQMAALTMVLAKAVSMSKARDGFDPVSTTQEALAKAIQLLSVSQ